MSVKTTAAAGSRGGGGSMLGGGIRAGSGMFGAKDKDDHSKK